MIFFRKNKESKFKKKNKKKKYIFFFFWGGGGVGAGGLWLVDSRTVKQAQTNMPLHLLRS